MNTEPVNGYTEMNIGVYVHIPFCRKKCDYCSFYSVPSSNLDPYEFDILKRRYCERLLNEIRERSKDFRNYNVDTVYFGGGTPSLIEPSYLKSILDCIHDNYSFNEKESEITIECNPEDFSLQRAGEYVDNGFNRLVLGLQTLNDRLHSFIGRSSRLCSEDLIRDFCSVPGIVRCIDLMTAIPDQSDEELLRDLSLFDKYNIHHVSAYILSIESGTRLSERQNGKLHSDNRQRHLFETVINFLEERGYTHYEVSNFALPSFESRHNLKYWQFLPYIGFGAASHSFYNKKRYYNPSSIDEYINSTVPLIEDERNENSIMIEYIMTGVRLKNGISLSDLQAKTGARVPGELINIFEDMEKKGLITVDKSDGDVRIKFSREGFFIMDSLIYEMTDMML